MVAAQPPAGGASARCHPIRPSRRRWCAQICALIRVPSHASAGPDRAPSRPRGSCRCVTGLDMRELWSYDRGNPEVGAVSRGWLSRADGLGPPPLLATLSATSAATPKRSMRPPKAIPQSTNQAQPSASPPITSLSQWKSRSTLLDATATAIPTAAPAKRARAARGRRRPSSSAAAAQKAAAVVVWPLGKDGPRVSRRRVERGARSVDEVLDQGGDQLFAPHDRDDERHQPPVRQPYEFDGDEQDAQTDHHRDRSELRDRCQSVRRERRGVAIPPLGDAVVDRGQGRVRPDEVGQSPEHHTCPDDEERAKRQPEAGLRLGIESRGERELEHRVSPGGVPDGLGGCDRRSHPRDASSRVSPREETCGCAGSQREQDEDEERHDQ